jgi:urea transport system ATP-binding protein
MSEAPLLQLQNVVVDFDGFKAINDLSLTIPSGSMTVVIGPNGAGKSTMCDSIIGRVRATSGKVLFHGREIQDEAEHAIVGLGICRKFQTPGVLVGLSVIDNLTIAATRDRRWWTRRKRGPVPKRSSKWYPSPSGVTRSRAISRTAKSNGSKSAWSWRPTPN